MRPPHFIKPNHATSIPRHAIWVDTETRPTVRADGAEEHHLWFGWAAYRRRLKDMQWSEPQWLRFTSIRELWDWVEAHTEARTRTYIFAHNWGFDGPVLDLFRELPRRGWECSHAILEGPPTIIPFRRYKPGPSVLQRMRHPFRKERKRAVDRSLTVLDTLNIWRMPLARLGKSLGLPKLDMPEPGAEQREWDVYGKRDVEIIMAACLEWWRFLKTHDLGNFQPTLAGQALSAFRHRFMSTRIYCDDRAGALAQARASAHGGRTECWHVGELAGPLYLYDVNSLYPYVMHKHPMPTKLMGWYGRMTPRMIRDRCVDAAVCVRTRLETEDPIYPVVHEGRLIFPVGHFTADLCTPEYRHAFDAGHVVGVEGCAVYATDVIFRDYVDYLWALRRQAEAEGNTVLAGQCKLLLNSLYGKFGQRARHWEDRWPTPELESRVWTQTHAQAHSVSRWRQIAGVVQELVDKGESYYSHPAIAAHVTAYARMYLWELILAAGRENVRYMDTDSLLVTEAGSRRLQALVDPEALGALKLEGTFDRVELRGPKDYTMDEKLRVKGVRHNAEWLDASTVVQDHFVGLKGLIESGNLTAPVVMRRVKHLSRVYRKGIVAPDGCVSPLRLEWW